jgi:cation diffusion facilitator CzcD-associated flavoprotein CzcO
MIEGGCEVAVVGAGVVGMATAKALVAGGLDVNCFE